MSTKTGIVTASIIVCLLAVSSLLVAEYGHWTEGGEVVCSDSNEQIHPNIVADGSGGSIIAWFDDRSAGGHYYGVYVQKMLGDGNVDWTTDGIAVVDRDAYPGFETPAPQIVSDGYGGAIVAWDCCAGAIVVQRIDADGDTLWPTDGYGRGGVTVYYPANMEHSSVNYDLAPDGTGGALISWTRQEREGVGYDYDYYVDVQRVNATGDTLLWGDGEVFCGLRLSSNPDFTAAPCTTSTGARVISDGSGGAIVAWHELGDSVVAARISPGGSIMWSKKVNEGTYTLFCGISDSNSPQIVSDGSGGAIVSWNHLKSDNWNHKWYSIYAQRVDSNGDTQWLTDAYVSQYIYPVDNNHAVITDGDGGAIYTFGSSHPTQPTNELWVQRIDEDGIRQWTTNYGVEIVDSSLVDSEFDAAPDGYGGVIVTWNDDRDWASGTYQGIYAQRIDANGTEQWTSKGLEICTTSGDGSQPAIAYHGNRGAIIAWKDERDDADGDIYAQRIDNCDQSNLTISNVDVTTTFNSSTYTWDAEFTFHTNLFATAVVYCGRSMDCFTPCTYEYQQSGSSDTTHSITIEDIAASTGYCYKITAAESGDPAGCPAEDVTGSFTVDNSFDEIYGVSADFLPLECKIKVSWNTKFPSKANKVYYRLQGTTTWSVKNASQADCVENRSYSAAFPVSLPFRYYEYKVYTEIDGDDYESSVYKKKTLECFSPPRSPVRNLPDLTKVFVHARPNPFNPQTTVYFNVLATSHVDMKVYAADGSYVTTLASGTYTKGLYHVDWNATNHRGETVSSGIYFVKSRIGSEILTSKILLLK